MKYANCVIFFLFFKKGDKKKKDEIRLKHLIICKFTTEQLYFFLQFKI